MNRHLDDDITVVNEEISDEEMSADDELSDKSVSDNKSLPTKWCQIVVDDPNLTSLRVGFNDYHPPNGDWASLGRAIGGNTHLKELIQPWKLPKEYFSDFFHGLASNESIQTFRLNMAGIADHEANILANGIIRNAPLKKLRICRAYNVSHIGWLAIFASLQTNPNCRLQRLELDSISINDAAALSLSNVLLRHNFSLKTLNISECINTITIAGFATLIQPLQDLHCRIVVLNLSRNSITDEMVAALTNALVNNSSLRLLDLSNNDDVTATGWSVLSAVLRNPNSALEKLDLFGNQIDDNVMLFFAYALANNNRLRELYSDPSTYSYIDFAAFTNILCNTSSILSTYRSNHTLERLCYDESREEYMNEDLRSLLELNSENSKSQAARLKIIKTHFSGSEINTQIFVDMESKVLPTAIAWMGQDDGNNGISDVLFAFLRSLPLLCDMKNEKK